MKGRIRHFGGCDLTHTATIGLSAVPGVNPQDAEFSLRNVASRMRLGG
jgi:hypothetical protein